MTTLIHKAVSADTATTEKGEFTALAATWSIDRMSERIVKGAFKSLLEAWAGVGRRVPLHWDHKGEAENIIGSIDPATMAETDDGLYVEGKLDIKDSAVAREVWRLVKANAVGLSFGYLVKRDRRSDGVRELLDLDLFEVSLTPAPINADTRVLSTKSMRPVRVAAFGC